MYLLLLRRASLFRHSGVYSLQSVPEAQSEAVSYRTDKGNNRTVQGCWLWPDGRKRTDLHLSGNVQFHAGKAERICSLSPSDIRELTFFSFCIFQQLCFMQCVIKESMDFRAHKKTQFYADQFPVLYMLLFTLFIHFHLPVLDFTSHIHTVIYAM